ncbi:MAG: DUF2815 family protein [Anaerorhabdus sp.]|uniref:DUF2815 family protein n=1 Tax=Anaerorhabdus sp. TaxID=1872524 RepID=UPI003A8A8847
MTQVNKNKATQVTTGLVRLSYEHLWEPTTMNEGDSPKFSASFIIDGNDKATLKVVNKAIEAAIELGINSKWGGKKPANLKLPLRDGEEREDEVYEGKMFVNANCSTQNKPFIVDRRKAPITDTSEVYSGCYGYAAISFYPFNSNGNKGIACGLNGFMKVKDGEPLANRITADDAFDGIEIDEDDLLD